jgi:hypothetical protein
MTQLEVQATASRIGQPRRTLRRFGIGLMCATIALSATVGIWARVREVPSRSIETKELLIVGDDGRTLIRLGMDREGGPGPTMEFFGSDGKVRVLVGLGRRETPSISVTDPESGGFAVLNVDPVGGPTLAFRNQNRKHGLLLGAGPGGVAGLGFMADDGRPRLQMGLMPEGSGQIKVFGLDGKTIFQVPQ